MTALPGLFVVGTDTGVGKTRVASAIARGLACEGRQPGVLKPVATGVGDDPGRGEDAARLIAAVGGSVPPERVAPIVFAEPLAPVVAARRLGGRLEPDEVNRAVESALDWWAERADVMVVEGVGGLLAPLAEGTTVADLAIRLDFPLVIVARRGLGTLNHTLLTVEAARLRGIRVAGVVLNGAEPTRDEEAVAEATNADELARRLLGIAVLAEVPHVGEGSEHIEALIGRIDWARRAQPPRFRPAVAPPPEAANVIHRESFDLPGGSSEELTRR